MRDTTKVITTPKIITPVIIAADSKELNILYERIDEAEAVFAVLSI